MSTRTRYGAVLGCIALTLGGCSAQSGFEDAFTAEDLIGSFDSIAYDCEPTVTGDELAQYATLIVRGEITSLGPVIDEVSPIDEIESMIVQQFVVAEITVGEVITGNAAEEDIVAMLLSYTVEMQEQTLGAASIQTIAYLEPFLPDDEFYEYPQLGDISNPVFILPSPQAWVVELSDDISLLPLEHDLQVEAPLEEFMPSSEEWPYTDDN